MQWLCLFTLILFLGCYSVEAQRQDCRRIKEQCSSCLRRLVNPKNELEYINRDCREKLRDRWVWRDVRRCDMQIIACENHDQKLDCETVARLAGMRRLIG
ncbi:uncharacterized protein Eig71Ej [Drosophila kikkawai]|uniref:Uncharacterized protein Eig71Ej n=1 Tax=Drosophila kikkawai TaxID=30033 RepID=A0A6P4JEX5_DROKI|nr:uncharacterized protein LOC108082965 [Drosophila kikkawai]